MKISINKIAAMGCALLIMASTPAFAREVLYNVTFGDSGLTFDVTSFGCTVLEDFTYDVNKIKGVTELTILRENPDTCAGPMQRASFTVDYATAGISSTSGIVMRNNIVLYVE